MSEIEEREAALFNGYTWKEWQALSYEDRVDGTAHYRISHYISLVRNEIENQTIENRSRQAERSHAQ